MSSRLFGIIRSGPIHKKILLGILIFASAWTFHCILIEFNFQRLSPASKLQTLVQRDIERLEKHRSLPSSWQNISTIEYSGGDQRAKKWLNQGFRMPLALNKSGNYRLEVLILSFEDQSQQFAILQYNLVNLKTQNMEWEMGRTFNLTTLSPSFPLEIISEFKMLW